MEVLRELSGVVATLGFFIFLLAASYIKNKQTIKKAGDCSDPDKESFYINSKMKMFDRIFGFFLGLIVLAVPVYSGFLDTIDIAQMLLVVIIYFSWHHYLFISRKLPSYETISALNNLDKAKDYAALLLISIFALLLPILVRNFNIADALQALIVFVIAYGWHRYLFSFKH